MNDEKKPPAPAPAVAKPSPTAPTRIPKASRCQAMAAAGLVMAGCAHHVFTGTQAGDCSVAPVREVPAPNPEKALDLLKHHSDNPALLPGGAKLRIPPELPVVLDRSNPEGKCKTGNPELIEEPCPVWEGRIVVEVNNYVWDSPGGRTSTPSVLIGETHIIPAKETREEPTVGVAAARPIRDVTGRMTARFTHLRTPDGTMWPVCGELFGWDEKEGVQILAPRYYGKPSTTNWAGVKARFFWAP